MKHWIIILTLVLVIIGLFLFILLHKPEPRVVTDDKILRDSITVLNRKIDSSKARQARLEKAYDSLVSLEPPVIHRTRDKIKFILTDASPDELDSIIRANWKHKSRYR